ncbi:nitroreductase family protein [Desulfobulbus sp.]|uniref:nitroreductase family protein n=1 Tax=Desulfobulbus sp. TaxID=895 RepID=UPI00286F9C18|nr:nitroreductase family protein [Desulfobulbus sp.]
MELFTVNQETCNRDGICAAVCPIGIIAWRQGELPAPAPGAEQACIRCGHCVAVCPTASLRHRDMPLETCPPVRPELRLGPEQCAHFIRARRSIRTYKERPVEHEKLAQLIDMAHYAPSGINSQGAHWLVIGNREHLHRLSGMVVEWMGWVLAEMPELARGMHVQQTIEQWHAGRDVILRGAPVLIVAHADKEHRMAASTCTIALTTLELAATSLGLGGCWAGYFNAAATVFPPLQAALDLPEGHQCFGAMMIGYPKFAYHRLPTRKTPPIDWRM